MQNHETFTFSEESKNQEYQHAYVYCLVQKSLNYTKMTVVCL